MTIETNDRPEPRQGHDEMARPSDEVVAQNAQPSVNDTDRYNLGDNGRWLLKQYNIELDDDGMPQFVPIPSVLNELHTDAAEILSVARGQLEREGSEKILAKVEQLRDSAVAFHDAVDTHYSDVSEWIPRTTVVWPVDNQVARNLFQAAFGEWKLADSIARAVAYGRIKDASNKEVMSDDNLAKQDGWVQVYYTELAIWDAVSQACEDHDYNLSAMMLQGYRQQCAIDTKKFLRGGNQYNQPSNDGQPVDAEAIKAELRASRRRTA